MKLAHWLLAVAVAWWLRQGGAPAALADCQHQCGDLRVPYPFGLDLDCARSRDFVLNCTNTDTEGRGIQLLLGRHMIRQISVGDSTMVVSLPQAYECYDQNGDLKNNSGLPVDDLPPSPRYSLSDSQNNLIVLGCGVLATVDDTKGTFGSGCVSYCGDNASFANETTCSGQGCCQASIPRGLKKLRINVSLVDTDVSASRPNGCGVAFVVDKRSFNSSNWTLPSFGDVGKGADLRLEWTVEPDVDCDRARQDNSSYACVGNNTECRDVGSGPGYKCVCKNGYEGNPYNLDRGCTDVNECEDPRKYDCFGKCRNTPGNFTCYCPRGKKLKGRRGCQVSSLSIALGVMAVSIFGITVTASVSVTWDLKIRKLNFRRNGGEYLKHSGIPIFTRAELAQASNNYDDSRKLSDSSFSSVHRGIIERNNAKVVVKKLKNVRKSQISEDFQGGLETLMTIRCKNVVKLKGVCLETEIPLLVYEYVPDGTLFQHIHSNASAVLESWEDRFRIAAEVAHALDLMHSSKKSPIIHGNIKSANILLDQDQTAKVSDFGTSVLIKPEYKHVLAAKKQDLLGYIDPESLITGMLTTRSDVYSFGVILVELLTGEKISGTKSGQSTNILSLFTSHVKDETLSEILFKDAGEDEVENVQRVAEIAVQCLAHRGEDRLPMSEVAQQLASIYPISTGEDNIEEPELQGQEKQSLAETSQDWASSCLTCLGDSCSCV